MLASLLPFPAASPRPQLGARIPPRRVPPPSLPPPLSSQAPARPRPGPPSSCPTSRIGRSRHRGRYCSPAQRQARSPPRRPRWPARAQGSRRTTPPEAPAPPPRSHRLETPTGPPSFPEPLLQLHKNQPELLPPARAPRAPSCPPGRPTAGTAEAQGAARLWAGGATSGKRRVTTPSSFHDPGGENHREELWDREAMRKEAPPGRRRETRTWKGGLLHHPCARVME